ncbi:PAS domain S-box protein [Spirosoma aureum]|uniref:histidine kinase n=1 Tax=Spirosoma aureum TaxID=2692134 RepID=A0A6G9ANE7_9BACT|nr:PAS domain S-box protein [Spirosoma aureum]QIP13733.1 PAS domain S-box protein [Spirosoma aureum]
MNPTNPLKTNNLKDDLATAQKGVLVFQAIRSPDGALTDLLLTKINNRAELDLGRQTKDLLGQSLHQLLPHLVKTGVINHFHQVMETEQPAHIDQLFALCDRMEDAWRNVSAIKQDDCLVISYDPTVQISKDTSQLSDRLQEVIDGFDLNVTILEPVYDPQGEIHDFRFVMINEAGISMSGYSRQQLLGRTVSEIYPSTRRNGFFTHYVDTYQTGQLFTGEQFYPEYDCWRIEKITRISRGLMITYKDSLLPNHTEEEGSQQAQLIHTILENVPIGIAILRVVRGAKNSKNYYINFRITRVNSLLKDLFGKSTRALEGELLTDAFADANASGLLSRCMNGIERADVQEFEMPFVHNGKTNWYRIVITPQSELLMLTFTDITSIKQSLLAHHQQAEELRTVLDCSPNTIVAFDALRSREGQIVDFRCTFQNRIRRQGHGSANKPKAGSNPFNFSPQLRDKVLLARYADVVKTGRPFESKVMVREGQQVNWRDQTVVKSGDGVVVTITNKPAQSMSERSDSDHHKHFPSTSYEAIFATATIGIIICDQQGRIVLTNQLADRLLGYPAGEMDNLTIEQLVPSSVSHYHEKLRKSFNADPQVRPMGHNRDLHAQRKDGSVFPVEVSLSHFQLDDTLYVVAYIIDISVKKEAERQLLAHQSQIEQLNSELEEKVADRTQALLETLNQLKQSKEELTQALSVEQELGELKSRFVAMASHEFRSPLTALLNSATLIGKYTTSDQQDKREKHLARIRASVNHLNDILEEFLSVGKLEEGKIEAHPSSVDIAKLVSEVLTDLNATLKPGQTIQTHLSCLSPVWLDGSLLRKILVNLLSNALKYSEAGSVVQLRGSCLMGQLTLSVQDQGIGISAEDQEHLFERFFRATNVGNRTGTGLGLHIVGRYIDLMGGDISLQSEVNQGTTITISIPYEDAYASQ